MKRLITAIIIVTVMMQVPAVQAKNTVPYEVQQTNLLATAVNKKQWNWAATYAKRLAVYYDDKQNYVKAAEYYDMTARYWELDGHPSWGIANTIRADHIRTELDLYIAVPVQAGKLAKHEPASGTYIGMYAAEKRASGKPELIEGIYEKKHAYFLTYTKWRQAYKATNSVFPVAFAEKVKEAGGALQIGWEPMNGLDDVKDDAYVRQFAREAREAGIPIFLRYASEMNGEWVPWYGDPKKYIEKFRLIHDIMKEEAPNVAMVWSPNFLPRHNIEPYYPGDEYVDWVGFSLYTIPFSHGNEVPGGNPIDYLRPLYEQYSHKPIIISEGAVSHYSYEQHKDYTDWAVGQLGNMYAYMARLFPQVKAITYFNLDKKTTDYDNKNNNYDIGDNPAMDRRYKQIIRSGYFLSDIEQGANNKDKAKYVPFSSANNVTGEQKLFTYVKLPLGEHPYYVALYQGKTKLGESYAIPWEMKVDFSKVDRNVPLTLIAFDRQFKRLAQKDISL